MIDAPSVMDIETLKGCFSKNISDCQKKGDFKGAVHLEETKRRFVTFHMAIQRKLEASR